MINNTQNINNSNGISFKDTEYLLKKVREMLGLYDIKKNRIKKYNKLFQDDNCN